MPKPSPAKPDEAVWVLERLGVIRIRQSGSHAIYRHPDGRWATVPIHRGRDLGKGLLRRTLKDAGFTADEFDDLR